jgi:hypothetical protein
MKRELFITEKTETAEKVSILQANDYPLDSIFKYSDIEVYQQPDLPSTGL